MKILQLSMIVIVTVGAIAFWMFYESSLLKSDKEKFSKPIIEQVSNHAKLAKLFGLNTTDSNYIVNLYDWSKDDKFIIAGFYISNKNYLVSITPDGTTLEKLNTPNIDGFYGAKISPSSKYVLFSGVKLNARGAGSSNLYLYDIVNKTMMPLTNNTTFDDETINTVYHDYGWTPDDKIMYNEISSSTLVVGRQVASLWSADATGKKINLLCRSSDPPTSVNDCYFTNMDISPDGKELVYPFNSHIVIFHMDTNQTTVIANSSIPYSANPRWIPNSASIVYAYPTDEYTHRWKLGIMSTTGSFNEDAVYVTGWDEGLPVVSPDGKYIMFVNSDNDIMRVRFG